MCGISGVVCLGEQALDSAYLKEMGDVIAHRGPDDAGYYVGQISKKNNSKYRKEIQFTDKKFQHLNPHYLAIDSAEGKQQLHADAWDVFLAHRRLAIIDTSSAGHQPMSDVSKEVWITYNGEVYNFNDIKSELIKRGHTFSTHTDTEVLIYAYREWGIEFIHKLNGMFAFALWDKQKNKFFLVRDRYGIKPLYYTLLPNFQLVFASEIKSIIQYPIYKMQLDYEALVEYFTFQNIFTDKTLYQNIKLLPAGHYIELNLNSDNPSITPQQYWDFTFTQPDKIKCEHEYAEELERLFVQAVTRQLVGDVEIGSYLSGGMDSGSVTAVAAKHFPTLKTFTIGFDLNNISGLELGYDERAKSEYLSYLYKTEHYEMVLKSSDMERCMDKLAWHLEEPRVGQSYPNYYAAKLAGKFVNVVLSGVGSDELYGGYPWRYYRAIANANFDDYMDKYYMFWHRLMDGDQLKQIFSPISNEISHVSTMDIFRSVFKSQHGNGHSAEEYVNHSLYFEAKTFLHGLLLVEDKLSMAHSLEARVPFLDNDLVDFSTKIPVNLKLGNLNTMISNNKNIENMRLQFDKSQNGKMILRKSLRKWVPEQYIHATKQGFSSPDKSWFKGDSIEFIKKKLLNNDAHIYNYLDPCLAQNLIHEHLDGKQNRRLLVWSLLNFEYWCKNYVV